MDTAIFFFERKSIFSGSYKIRSTSTRYYRPKLRAKKTLHLFVRSFEVMNRVLSGSDESGKSYFAALINMDRFKPISLKESYIRAVPIHLSSL